MSTTTEEPTVDAGWHQIHRYAYVARPYDDVWAALAGDRTLALPDGIVDGGVPRLPLRVRLAGVEVTRPVIVTLGGLVVDGDRSRLSLSWFDKGRRNFFPVLEADLNLAPADFRGSKLRKPVAGDVIWSAPTLLTLSPVGAPLAHAALHVTAVAHSYDTDTFLPPHSVRR